MLYVHRNLQQALHIISEKYQQWQFPIDKIYLPSCISVDINKYLLSGYCVEVKTYMYIP